MIDITFFFIGISITILIIGKWLLNDGYHPLALSSSFWFFLASIASYEPWYNSDLQTPWSLDMKMIVFLGGISIFLPAMLFKSSRGYNLDKIYINNKYKIFLDFLAILTVIVFLIRFKSDVLHPTILRSGVGDLKELVPPGITGLHYIDLMTPIIGIYYIFELLYSKNISRLRRISIVIYSVFVVVNIIAYKVSRDELTQYLVCTFFLIYVSRPQYRFRFWIFFIVFLAIFSMMTVARLSENSSVFSQFSGDFGPIFSMFYTYSAINFENLNKLTNTDFSDTYIWGSLRFILRLFYSDEYENNQFNILDIESSFFNAKTYLYMFYHDLRIYGVILYSFIIGVFVQLIYILAKKNIRYLPLLSILMKPLLFLFFGNFFFVELTYFFVYPFGFFLCLLLFSRVRFWDGKYE